MNMNKYHNIKNADGDSAKERNRKAELKLMERGGLISDLRFQVRYLVIPAQYAVIDGKRTCLERQCIYVADFVYKDKDGNLVVEDCKGVKTPAYIIKRKLMLKNYGIRIKET